MNELIEYAITNGEWLEAVQGIVEDFLTHANDIVSMLGSVLAEVPGWLNGYIPYPLTAIVMSGLGMVVFLRVIGRNQ